MSNLKNKMLDGRSRIIFYSLTPPKITTAPERVLTIAATQAERLRNLDIDGLILYDIQDESLRTDETRTFSFIPSIPPETYSKDFLIDLPIPRIIYKSIANQTKEDFQRWLMQNKELEYMVFVGATSHQQVEATNFSLSDAYALKQDIVPDLLLGGVTIPERHGKKADEHHRIFRKMEHGCGFFVSQCVYNINDTKNLLSDYYYGSQERACGVAPIIFTLAPCGSLKTLQFMKWLGIEVPKWLYNDLKHAKDILASSIDTCINIAGDILNYAEQKNIPVGFNIESISIKKEEIEAAHEVLKHVLQLTRPARSIAENKLQVSG
ncbi:methylenetetrahydrofolate reductase [Chitinophaga defluvii]|uniref:5,10-methylenetetrahydrofolate reductase n=1 Tax=Chitinophaga defluvii TaxID=3163343 RepID=A0ABV2T1L0_9BACT